MLNALMLRMPNLEIDENFERHLNDTKGFQRLSKCISCGKPYQIEKKLNEVETRILSLVYSLIAIFLLQLIVGIVGSVWYFINKKATNNQPKHEEENSYEEINGIGLVNLTAK
jgi:hypothetical protein